MASIAPIRLYGHQSAPNPWKVVIICNELAIPFEHVYTPFQDMKKPPFLKLNPNGRVPVIEDPNTGTTVWESGVIIEYLIDTYDTKETLTYTTTPQKWSLRSWEHFQLTVQDQYFGQKAYFALFHKNKDIPTVTEYFGTEVKRALGVIDLHLARTGQQYLVGEKCTFVDLMYLPFNVILSSVLLHKGFDEEWKREMPHCYTWHQVLMQRKSVQDALQMKARAEQEMGLRSNC